MKPITIEQDLNDTKMAVEVHQSTAISRIRLVRAKLSAPMLESATSASAPISVEFTFRSKALESPPDTLRIEITFKMTGTTPENPPSVSVECAYAVDYTIIRPGFAPTTDQVKAFKDGNAIFNVWPYFREYLQSSLSKMGLPPLVAPFLCLRPKPLPAKPKSPDSKSQAKRPSR